MGNVIGSNLFNSLAVIGIPALLTNFQISPEAFSRDLSVTLALTLGLFVMSRYPSSSCCLITRNKGILLLSAFVLYQGLLYYQAAVHS
jgi:cation:H+ antiporter